MSTRDRRIENEWKLLQALAAANPARFRALARQPDGFTLTLTATPGLLLEEHEPVASRAGAASCATAATPGVRLEHALRLEFPRWYPSMPLEAYLEAPVFHPNIHPVTGFLCLWTVHRVNHTIEHALQKIIMMLAGKLFNRDAPHVMQAQAMQWYEDAAATHDCLELKFQPLTLSEMVHAFPADGTWRRRLA